MPRTLTKRDVLLAGLHQVTIFSCLSDAELEELAGAASLVRFAAGGQLLEEGTAGTCVYVLLKGTATVWHDGAGIAARGPGDCLGELALLDDHARSASVTADGPLLAVKLEREVFDRLLTRPGFVRSLLRALCSKLRESASAQAEGLRRRDELVEILSRFLDQGDAVQDEGARQRSAGR